MTLLYLKSKVARGNHHAAEGFLGQIARYAKIESRRNSGLEMGGMSYRLYIDTSVFGALFDDEDPDRVTLTETVLRRLKDAPFEAFIGTPVLEEISIAPLRLRVALERHVKSLSPTLIEEGSASLRLADAYMAARLSRHQSEMMLGISLLRPSPILTRLFLGISVTWST